MLFILDGECFRCIRSISVAFAFRTCLHLTISRAFCSGYLVVILFEMSVKGSEHHRHTIVYYFFGKLSHFLRGNFREPCPPFVRKQKQKRNCVQCCHGNHQLLLLFHYYAEIVILSINQNSEISRLIL